MCKYLIVLIWIPVRLALRGSGPRQDPRCVITALRLMDPGVRRVDPRECHAVDHGYKLHELLNLCGDVFL